MANLDDPSVLILDDFVFDLLGNICYTDDPYNQLVKVTPGQLSH